MPHPRQFLTAVLGAVLGGCAASIPKAQALDLADLAVVDLKLEQASSRDDATRRALLALDQRDADAAVHAAEQALRLDPRAARARAALGLGLLAQSQRQDPADLFLLRSGEVHVLTAVNLAPNDATVAWLHARFLTELGHGSAALAVAQAALTNLHQTTAEERARLLGLAASHAYELGEDTAAVAHLREYCALQDHDAQAHYRLGCSLLRLVNLQHGADGASAASDQITAAIAAFTRAYELAPLDIDAGLGAGIARMRAGDSKTAESHFVALGEHFSERAEPWFCAALAREALGEQSAAVVAYQEALRRDPVHLGALLNLAKLTESAQPELAQDAMRRALALDAASPVLAPSEREALQKHLAVPQKPRIE